MQFGAPEEIYHRPESAFVAGFMGADNALDLVEAEAACARPSPARRPRPGCARIFAATPRALRPSATAMPADALVLPGVDRAIRLRGHGYRYRVRTDGAEVWVRGAGADRGRDGGHGRRAARARSCCFRLANRN